MKRSSRKSWPEETLQALFITMECAWLAAIMVFFDIVLKPGGHSLGWSVLMYGPAYVFGRVSVGRGFHGRSFWCLNGLLALICLGLTIKGILLPDLPLLDPEKIISGIWGLATTAKGWPPLAVIGVGGLYIYGRGWYLSGRQTETEAFFTAFQAGFVIILVTVLLVSMAGITLQRMLGLIALFFISGLTGLYLARLIAMGAERKAGGPNPWLMILPLVIGSMILGGWALMVYVDQDFILILLQPFFWLWAQLVRFLNFLAGLLDPKPVELPLDPMQGLPKPPPKASSPIWDFAWVKTVGNIFFIVGTTGLVMGALFRFLEDLMRWLRRKLDDQGIVVESLETGLWTDLVALIALIRRRVASVLNWIWRRLGAWLNIGSPPQISETQLLRDTYRRMLKWGASQGLPKQPGQTPYEYLETLEPILHEKQAAFRAATEHYVRFRYGPMPAEPSHVSEMKSFWDVIKEKSLNRRKAKKMRSQKPGPAFGAGPGQEEVLP